MTETRFLSMRGFAAERTSNHLDATVTCAIIKTKILLQAYFPLHCAIT